jgi:hypothetical protein
VGPVVLVAVLHLVMQLTIQVAQVILLVNLLPEAMAHQL